MRDYNVHERARQLQAQAARPMSLHDAYAELARRAAARRKSHGAIVLKRSAAAHIETIETPTGPDSWTNIPQQTREIRLPYRDD